MNQKKQDLEAILDLLKEWATEYNEDFVTMTIHDQQKGMAWIPLGQPDCDDVDISKQYNKSPGAATPKDSR